MPKPNFHCFDEATVWRTKRANISAKQVSIRLNNMLFPRANCLGQLHSLLDIVSAKPNLPFNKVVRHSITRLRKLPGCCSYLQLDVENGRKFYRRLQRSEEIYFVCISWETITCISISCLRLKIMNDSVRTPANVSLKTSFVSSWYEFSFGRYRRLKRSSLLAPYARSRHWPTWKRDTCALVNARRRISVFCARR